MSASATLAAYEVPQPIESFDAEELLLASPTAALGEKKELFAASASSPNSRAIRDKKQLTSPAAKKIKKAVSFAPDAKPHDGLSSRSELLEKIVMKLFVKHEEVSQLDVMNITNRDPRLIYNLYEDLIEIKSRIQHAEEEGQGCIPILSRGGGKYHRLLTYHLKYLEPLEQVVKASHDYSLISQLTGQYQQ